MYNNNQSPLEYLASFLISAALGALTVIGVKKYVDHVEQEAHDAHRNDGVTAKSNKQEG